MIRKLIEFFNGPTGQAIVMVLMGLFGGAFIIWAARHQP